MRSQPRPTVALVIPTLVARNSLPQTLASLAPHAHLFDTVVLSFNGVRQEGVDPLAALEPSIAASLMRLETGRLLPAIEHAHFIGMRLAAVLPPDSHLFLLADDDLLPVDVDLGPYIQSCLDGSGCAVGIGRFLEFQHLQGQDARQSMAQASDVLMNLWPGESIDPLTFLQRNHQRGNAFTNMSSMLVPLRVYVDAIRYMDVYGSAGRRFEYILAAHASVCQIVSPALPSALIRSHPEQEHKTLRYSSLRFDELLYVIWVWRQQPRTRPLAPGSRAYGFNLFMVLKLLAVLLFLNPLYLLGRLDRLRRLQPGRSLSVSR
jgi:hypothetical protein